MHKPSFGVRKVTEEHTRVRKERNHKKWAANINPARLKKLIADRNARQRKKLTPEERDARRAYNKIWRDNNPEQVLKYAEKKEARRLEKAFLKTVRVGITPLHCCG